MHSYQLYTYLIKKFRLSIINNQLYKLALIKIYTLNTIKLDAQGLIFLSTSIKSHEHIT
jgi:hypothetical protein